ncbi:hypothetical protein [Nocardia niwae]|uniref:hypothetical protein n=1 Tax=Nocardia niwae TaxID=626084 RepID=UPI0033CFE335
MAAGPDDTHDLTIGLIGHRGSARPRLSGGTHWHHSPPLGDDFVEYLPLTASLGEDDTALIDLLRDADTAAWLIITVHPNTFSVELCGIGPS